MLSYSQLRAAVRAYLVAATSLEVIYANQNGPRPTVDYVTLLLASIRSVGFDHTGKVEHEGQDIGDQDYYGDRVASFSVQFFGSTAIDKARDSINALHKESVRQSLAVSGLYPRRIPSFSNVTELLDTDWERRAQFDLDFAYVDDYIDNMGIIMAVEMTATYTHGSRVWGPYTYLVDTR